MKNLLKTCKNKYTLTIADASEIDALIGDVRALPLLRVALERRGRAGVEFRVLVAAVAAVVLAVAYVSLEDAVGVAALEVARLAVDLAAASRLVALVVAVGRAVAVPGLGDADARARALELLVGVALVRRQGWTADLDRTGWFLVIAGCAWLVGVIAGMFGGLFESVNRCGGVEDLKYSRNVSDPTNILLIYTVVREIRVWTSIRNLVKDLALDEINS